MASTCEDISAHVPLKLKEKIWNGEFVDLSELLQKEPARQDIGQKVLMINGELVVKQKDSPCKIQDIDTYTPAFLIFTSIYISRHPDQVQGLLKHLSTVRLAASRQPGIGWKTYDTQYRLRKSLNPGSVWGSIDGELWPIYMGAKQNSTSYGNNQNQSAHPCYDFNYKGSCARMPCKYAHRCVNCNGNHGFITCFKAVHGSQFFNRPGVQRPFRGRTPQRYPRMPTPPKFMGPW